MPLAVTHVLSSIILVDMYRDYIAKHKRFFTLHTLVIAGIAGLLPDIDVVVRIIAEMFDSNIFWLLRHGGITHTPFFAFLFIIPGLILWYRRKHKLAVYFYVITFGIMLHITLDYVLGGGAYEGIMWFFPFSFVGYKLHLITMIGLPDLPQALDAIILLLWLLHEDLKHRIKDFI